MFSTLFPFVAPTYVVIPESRYNEIQVKELESELLIVESKLNRLEAAKKELIKYKESLNKQKAELKPAD